jgi:hypothetical protein
MELQRGILRLNWLRVAFRFRVLSTGKSFSTAKSRCLMAAASCISALCRTRWFSADEGLATLHSICCHLDSIRKARNIGSASSEPSSLLPDFLGYSMVCSQDRPFRCFRQAYIARNAGRAISGSPIEVGFRCNAAAGLRNKLRAADRESAVGHEERFPPPRLKGRCPLQKRSAAVND